MQEFFVFTLEEANEALPSVIRVTEETVAQLAELEEAWGKLPFKKFDALQGVRVEDVIRADWAQRIASMGIQPKGFFVVDFQSPDPDTLYCWGYGEDAVEHEHKTWETFIDRRPILNADPLENHPPAPPHDIRPEDDAL